MKKKFGLLLVAALASFALVGCGDSASSYKELTSYTNEDSQEVTISNSSLELTVDKDTTTFVLKDKKMVRNTVPTLLQKISKSMQMPKDS